ADESGTLNMIRRKFGHGTITRDSGTNPMVRWAVGDKAGCVALVELLDKYPLRAKKMIDYWSWRDAVIEWVGRPRGNRWHGAAESGTLNMIRRKFGHGTITRDSGTNPMVRWAVGDKAGCVALVELLDKYPLRAKKMIDYWSWRDAVIEWVGRPRGNRWHGAA